MGHRVDCSCKSWEAEGGRERLCVSVCVYVCVHEGSCICTCVCSWGICAYTCTCVCVCAHVCASKGLPGRPSWHLRNPSPYLQFSILACLSGYLQPCFSGFLVSVCLSQLLWLTFSSWAAVSVPCLSLSLSGSPTSSAFLRFSLCLISVPALIVISLSVPQLSIFLIS